MQAIVDSKNCLSIRTLQRLTQRDVEEHKIHDWVTHLIECSHCSQAAVSLNLSDAILQTLASIEGQDGTHYQKLQQRFFEHTEVETNPGLSKLKFESIDNLFPMRTVHPAPVEQAPQATIPTRSKSRVTSPLQSAQDSKIELPSAKLLQLFRPAQAKDELGRLAGYRVLKVLGSGAVGVVFLAEDISLRRKVALKLLRPDDLKNTIARERFLREGRAIAAFEHPHIVSVYQVGEENNVPFMAMQFLEGETLDEAIKRKKRLNIVDTIRIAREIASGLSVAHDRGLVHRDIKPANIWLEGNTGRVKILDFGLARSVSDEIHLTKTGNIVGTPAYMSPEQAKGGDIDQRSDLYSLGCLIYTMCAGVTPFQADDVMSMLLALATEQPRPLQSHNPDLPPPLLGLVNRLLVKHPEARPASAKEVMITLSTIEKMLPSFMPGNLRGQWLEMNCSKKTNSVRSGWVPKLLWTLILFSVGTVLVAYIAPDRWKRDVFGAIKKMLPK